MKTIIILFACMLIGLSASAQGRGNVGSVTLDTIKGAETVNFNVGQFTGSYESLTIQALCAEIGGTSDGSLTLWGSVDGTSYSFINGDAGGLLTASPNASITSADTNRITITDALVASWVIRGTPFRNYRIAGIGTSGDTTSILIKYIYK